MAEKPEKMLTMVDYNYSSKYLETLSNFRKAKRVSKEGTSGRALDNFST